MSSPQAPRTLRPVLLFNIRLQTKLKIQASFDYQLCVTCDQSVNFCKNLHSEIVVSDFGFYFVLIYFQLLCSLIMENCKRLRSTRMQQRFHFNCLHRRPFRYSSFQLDPTTLTDDMHPNFVGICTSSCGLLAEVRNFCLGVTSGRPIQTEQQRNPLFSDDIQ